MFIFGLTQRDIQEMVEHAFLSKLEYERFSSLKKSKITNPFKPIRIKRYIKRVIRSPCKYTNKLYS